MGKEGCAQLFDIRSVKSAKISADFPGMQNVTRRRVILKCDRCRWLQPNCSRRRCRSASDRTTKEISVPHAQGSFTVDVHPLTPTPAAGLSRFTINKVIHGDLEATTIGEMLAGGDPKQGAAGYVAIEVVTGTLGGKHGSFALQHFATMDASGPKMQVIAVPGSGTGDLKGIEGTFLIRVEEGKHSYDFDYTLPEVQ
jgi:hypothetical protein